MCLNGTDECKLRTHKMAWKVRDKRKCRDKSALAKQKLTFRFFFSLVSSPANFRSFVFSFLFLLFLFLVCFIRFSS
ncbi:uncharacterized protein BDW43DRAFT_79883 [Aspergillus alliaceus]|uniref:uncharacterized protein n=1 Tax=Petromyces alliaceus TaxID=209559 RepID=UPI0012A47831|nr:uncharacterized protein BDW43DRAFT_79883 [Aspergillus alliaceus]KAB8233839.1 hypothetical protein BDW43DRAFT_79883 [Aspergillus alliaceus]